VRSLDRRYLCPPIAVDARIEGEESGKVTKASRVAALVGSPWRGLQGKGLAARETRVGEPGRTRDKISLQKTENLTQNDIKIIKLHQRVLLSSFSKIIRRPLKLE
jgi:hypothetical protein